MVQDQEDSLQSTGNSFCNKSVKKNIYNIVFDLLLTRKEQHKAMQVPKYFQGQTIGSLIGLY